MKLPLKLRQEIIEFLISLPTIDTSSGRQAFLLSAGLDQQVLAMIDFSGPPAQFFTILVSILESYGTLFDGRDALEAVLEAAKNYVGIDRKKECDKLIQAFVQDVRFSEKRTQASQEGYSLSSQKTILILASNPKDTSRLRLDDEVRKIEEGLRRSKNRDQFLIHTKWAVRFDDIYQAILDYKPSIVHFTGHGQTDGLIVENEEGSAILINSDSLGKLFKPFNEQIVCVVLNVSYSSAIAENINRYIPYVIGMNKAMTDEAAVDFAVGFYTALGSGRSLEEAFEFGINALRLDGFESSIPILLKQQKPELQLQNLTDLEILHEIEKEIEISFSIVQNNDDIKSIRNSYIINEYQQIIAINLSGNRLPIVPNVIVNFKNLKTLILENNQLEHLPLELFELESLNTLRLGSNMLSELSEKAVNLKHLEHLSLDANLFKIFPIEMNEFPDLQELDLRNNQIRELPKSIIDRNIEIKWGYDGKCDGVYLEKNPLEKPPIEVVRDGRESIIRYFDSGESDYEILKEVKALLVGDGGAGKTSLVKRLLNKKFDQHEPQTHGININVWDVRNHDSSLKVNFWDFGGQEIMHATHQFFLSKRSLYVLVLDGRKDEDAEYWLKHIESFGGNSPILVVLNKIDDNPAFDVNRRFLQDKYKGIKGFYKISCAQDIGIKEFSENLSRELTYVEISNTTWPKSWFKVKKELETINDDFISYDQYILMCEAKGITDKGSQKKLVEFLHDLGVMLNFQESRLFDTHVLKPEWVTRAVYKIINSQQLAEAKGVLKLSLLDDILSKETDSDYAYPRSKYLYIIDLMRKFELCYELEPDTILIPDLLDVQEPRFDFDYTNALHFLIEYDFLPKSIIPRFTVKIHKDIKDDLRWRTGVVLKDPNSLTTAVIKADNRDRKISIAVHGEQKRDYFAVIRRTLKDINESFEQLVFDEKVPLPDYPQIAIEYEELLGQERMGKSHITIGKLGKEYSVKQLLDGIEREEQRRERESREGQSIHYHFNKSEVTIGTSNKEVTDMSTTINDSSTKIGTLLKEGAIVHGDVTGIVAEKIQNSFNKVESSDVSDNLKDILKKLSIEAQKMSEQLPKEQAEQMANDLQALTNEATSEKPRKKWWELSVTGIKEAAESVGEIGKTALILLKDLIPILEGIS